MTTTPSCTRCRRAIPAEDVNVAADVAFCRACNLAVKLSSLVADEGVDATFDPSRPPAGTWHRGGAMETVIGASHRSIPGAIGLLAVAAFWNGIVSVFVLVALSSTLKHLNITVPDWFPAPTMNGGPIALGMTIFLWIFLTPFIVIGLGMLAGFVSCLAGRTEIRIGHGGGSVFAGIGPVGWTRRFPPQEVSAIRFEDQRWRDSDGDARRKRQGVIVLRDGKELPFGSMLREERLRFVVAGARRALGTAGR